MYKKLYEQINYSFKNEDILDLVFTHKSSGENNNERLEFLGDAILGAVISEELYNRFTNISEGELTRIRASLVRGTTSYKIVNMLYDAGAKEVHVRIASPEIKFPDFYGIDMPSKKELLAANMSVDEICNYVKAKSLKFLSLNGLYKAMGFEKRNNDYPQLTDHYFTGDYPVKIIDELGEEKITQLSLLSTGSNN